MKIKEIEIKTFDKYPDTEHFAVLVFKTESYQEAGYDRGDPSYTVNMDVVKYLYFENKKDLLGWVEDTETKEYTYSSKPKYKVISVQPLEIKKTISIDI